MVFWLDDSCCADGFLVSSSATRTSRRVLVKHLLIKRHTLLGPALRKRFSATVMASLTILFPELVLRIAQKLSLTEFLKFYRSCKWIRELCLSRSNLLLLPEVTVTVIGEGIGIRYQENRGVMFKGLTDLSLFTLKGNMNIQTFFTDKLIQSLISLAESTAFRCISLNVFRLNCDPEDMKRLIRLTNPSELEISDSLSTKHYSPDLLRNMSRIQLSSTDYGDDELLELKAEDIRFQRYSSVTCAGINTLLKEWFSETRVVKLLQFKMSETDEEVLLEGITSNLLYETSSHEDSILCPMDDDELPSYIHDNSFYVLIRPSKLNEMLVLVVGESTVTVERVVDPSSYLLQNLHPRHYYQVTGRLM